MADYSDQYFATLPRDEITSCLLEKKNDYYKYLETTGRRALLLKSFETYHRPALQQGELWRSGAQGEYVNIAVNHFRNLLQHRLVLTTSQRPEFEPQAINTDATSQRQVRVAQGLLDYYERAKKMERYLITATEYAIAYAEGFVGTFWNPTKGDLYRYTDKGHPVFDGDLEFEAFTTFDVIRAPKRGPNEEVSWVMIRRYKNKWDLATKYPELKDEIINYQMSLDDVEWKSNFTYQDKRYLDRDDIPIYTFFHRKCEALPQGRMVEFTSDDICYFDVPIPYRQIPIFRITPNEQANHMFGYTNAFDLLPMQDALDKLYSTVLTNQAAFGVQNIAVEKGGGYNVTQLSGGLNIVEYSKGSQPPLPLNLTATPAEIFKFIDDLQHNMETLIGVNSVARGNPEANLKSGAALALVQSMAVQFAQGLQQSYAQLLEDVGTSVIEILQDYASTPRVALIAGKANRSNMMEFKGEDIQNISRVIVNMGNPMMRTTAGRVNLAEQLIQNGLIETPQQYIEVVTSGRVEPIYESEASELMLIRGENEGLQDGQPQQVIATDNHQLHIQEHKAVLASPEARKVPAIVAAVLSHIQQHMNFQPAPGQPPGPDNEMKSNAGQVAEGVDATNPVSQQAQTVKLPRVPAAPGTGV